MAEWLIISTWDAVEALSANRVVYAIETPGDEWVQVQAIEDVLEQGLRMPALRIRFASGHVRVETGAGLAGYVEDTSEGPVAFAFIVNGSSRRRADRGLDDLCSILCAAPALPGAL